MARPAAIQESEPRSASDQLALVSPATGEQGEKSQGTFQPRTEDKDFNTSQHSHKIFFNIRNILGNIFKSICHYLWLTSSFSQSQKKTNPYSFEKFHFKLISPLRVSSRHLRILTWGWRLNSPSRPASAVLLLNSLITGAIMFLWSQSKISPEKIIKL